MLNPCRPCCQESWAYVVLFQWVVVVGLPHIHATFGAADLYPTRLGQGLQWLGNWVPLKWNFAMIIHIIHLYVIIFSLSLSPAIFKSSAVYYWLVVSPPLKKLVNWDDYSQYMQKQKMFPTTNQILFPFSLSLSLSRSDRLSRGAAAQPNGAGLSERKEKDGGSWRSAHVDSICRSMWEKHGKTVTYSPYHR